MAEEQARHLAQGIASITHTMVQMGYGEDLVRRHILAALRTDSEISGSSAQELATPWEVLREASAEIVWLSNSTDGRQASRNSPPIRAMLGITSETERLTAAMASREWLEREARPDWHDVFTRVYRTALDAGDPAGDTALADPQDEARRHLETADLVDRVVASGTRP